jgi:transcriptional regulator with XRE-family HTH domain
MNTHRTQAACAFGKVLRAARRNQGLSQEDLAFDGGFDRTYPSLLERGLRTPTFLVILELAVALNIDPVVLFSAAVAEYRESQGDSSPSSREVIARKP